MGRKQRGDADDQRRWGGRAVPWEEALAASRQHTVPVLPAQAFDAPPPPTVRAPAAPDASYPATSARPTARQATRQATHTDAPQRSGLHRTLADLPTLSGPASSAPAASTARTAKPAGLIRRGSASQRPDLDDAVKSLVPGAPTLMVPVAPGTQSLAPTADAADHQLALREEPAAPALLIRGAAHPQRVYGPVVPRRTAPLSAVAQFAIAMISVVVIFSALTLTSPLAQTAGLTGTFQTYANAAPWIPTPTATPQPTATPIPRVDYVPPAGNNPGTQAIINEITAVFGGYSSSALNVARCESGFNPNAVNPYAIGNSHASGVFQVLYPSTWVTTSYASSSPFNADANIHAAYQIFQRDGYTWSEWQCRP